MRSLRGPVLATLVLGLALLLSALSPRAPAAVSLRPPPGTPDPKQVVLRTSDLGRGARVTSQRYYKDTDFPSVISYSREFESGRVGSTELLYADSEAEIGTSPQSTASFVVTTKRLLGTELGRALFEEGFAEEVPTGGFVSDLQVGRPRDLGVGAGSFDVLLTFRVLGLRTEAHLSVFRVDRVLGVLVTMGAPGERVPRSVMTRLAKIMAGRMRVELAPKNTVRPAISGTSEAGQTLTAVSGTWTGVPSSFAYQWQRCDSAGGSCASIPTATGQSYLLTEADVGSTIRVVVSARNALGTATAASAPTSVVSPSRAPVNTSLPTVSGVPQVGQTLTAGTGSWTGSPTSFSFQWQRCDAGGANCVDIPGATSGTYALAGADVGSTIRVAVTARNSVGEATAFSAPTAVVT